MEVVNGEETGNCRACLATAFCSTCIDSESQCTSCISGYSLEGIKCVSDTNIDMVLVLDATIDSFVLAVNNFKKDFMNNLGPPYSSNPQWLTINSI